jgi:hypothetical protein
LKKISHAKKNNAISYIVWLCQAKINHYYHNLMNFRCVVKSNHRKFVWLRKWVKIWHQLLWLNKCLTIHWK